MQVWNMLRAENVVYILHICSETTSESNLQIIFRSKQKILQLQGNMFEHQPGSRDKHHTTSNADQKQLTQHRDTQELLAITILFCM